MTAIKPREDGCYVYFHPTTVRVLQAIEDNAHLGWSMTWKRIAEIAGVSASTLYRHLEALESVNYIERSGGALRGFGGCIQIMSLNDPIEYECDE